MCENQVEVAKSQPVLLIGNRGNSMRYSGIGGQAAMEGVMMKNKNRYAGGSPVSRIMRLKS